MKSILSLSTIAFAMLMFNSCNSNSQSDEAAAAVKNIQQAEYEKLEAQENVVVIDVRTPGEIAEGKIKGADLFIDYRGDNFDTEIAKLDKEKEYIIYCRSGGRSASAANEMIKKGFKHVYNLEGGIMNWKGAVEK